MQRAASDEVRQIEKCWLTERRFMRLILAVVQTIQRIRIERDLLVVKVQFNLSW